MGRKISSVGRLVASVSAALALVLPATAAGATFWMSTVRHIRHDLITRYQTSDGENIVWARCAGVASHPHRWKQGHWWFHNFTCAEIDDLNRIFGVRVIVHSYGLDVVEYSCTDQHSNYSCPSASTTPTTSPPPTPTGCYPIASTGNCYEPGEFCPVADYGMTGVAGNGESIICEDNNGWRWEPY